MPGELWPAPSVGGSPDALHKDAFSLGQLHHMNHDSGLLFLSPSNNSTVIIFFSLFYNIDAFYFNLNFGLTDKNHVFQTNTGMNGLIITSDLYGKNRQYLCARPCTKSSHCIISFDLCNNSPKQVLLFSLVNGEGNRSS